MPSKGRKCVPMKKERKLIYNWVSQNRDYLLELWGSDQKK